MSTFTKPTTLPRWAETTGQVKDANIGNPSSGQQDTGWGLGQVATSGDFNWLHNHTYNWLAWLNQFLFNRTIENANDDPSISLQALPSGHVFIKGGAAPSGATDTNGAPVRIETGAGRGTGSGFLQFRVSTAGSSGTTLNTVENYLSLNGWEGGGLIRAAKEIRADAGMRIGTAETLDVVDTSYQLSITSSKPTIKFDTNDYVDYDRTANELAAYVGSAKKLSVSASSVGFLGEASFTMSVVSSNPRITLDANDYVAYDRSANSLDFVSNSITRVQFQQAFTNFKDASGNNIIRFDKDRGFTCAGAVTNTPENSARKAAFNQWTGITACARVADDGTLDPGGEASANRWNVSSVTRIGGGEYDITLAQGVTDNALILITPFGSSAAHVIAHATFTSSTVIKVIVRSTGGLLTDYGFSIAVIGGG